MAYFDTAIIPVPKDGKEKYLEHAREAFPLFKQHGAIRVIETWGDDVPEGKNTSLPMAVKCESDEVVVCSIIEWPDKKTRDEAQPKVMADMREKMTTQMPFDGSRMIFGGFDSVLDE